MSTPETRWAVILAGGSGTRLQSLTQRMFGDARPKQFCTLFGDRTLLGNTQARIARVIPTERTMFVVVKAHARYYQQELTGVAPSRVLVQPADRGTTAAIASSLAGIAALNRESPNKESNDGDAIVGFFPADHHFTDEAAFMSTVDRAYGLANCDGDKILLLGAQPDRPEVEYGWIEPGDTVPGASRDSVFRVNRFWEKPSSEIAHGLFERGCLWNTFVMIGRVRNFLEMLKEAAPSGDFSRQVLSALPDRLSVLRLDNVGWSDLGTPERVMAVSSPAAATAISCC